MKGILQTFIFLLFFVGAESLWGQCSINAPTITGVSCLNQGYDPMFPLQDSPSDDAIQFNLNVSSVNGSTQGFWIDVNGGTTVTPQEGTYGTNLALVLGNGSANGTSIFTITLTDKSDLSCQRTFTVGPQASCSGGCSEPVRFICNNAANPGPHTVTLTANAGLSNVLWFNSANVQVGAGSLVVSLTTPGMADGTETFYYTAVDGTGCVVSLCCPITVQTQDCGILDLALKKEKSDNLPVTIGQTITFNITVCNQGSDPVTTVSLIDYIPGGFTLADASWTLSGSNATRILTAGGGIIPAGGIPVNGCVTVPINMTVNANISATNINNYAEITAGMDSQGRTDDVDSTPDNISNNDPGGLIGSPADNFLGGDGSGTTPGDGVAATDEDDHDGANVRIVDLALIKEIITPGPYYYGTPVTFRITVRNQGNVTASNIAVTDYVPAGFSFSPNNSWSGIAPLITRNIAGPLAPGASTTVDLILTVQPSAATNAWLNIAEISSFNDTAGNPIGIYDIDSDPDQSPNNDRGGLVNSPADNYFDGNGTGAIGDGVAATDEDDQDPALINVFDLALKKELVTAGPYTNGQLLTFNITVYNQGNVDATNVVISDYIPNGYSFAPNGGWTGGPSTATYTIASLAAGASVVVPIQLTFLSPASSTPPNWVNRAEISSATGGTDADSTPDSMVGNDNLVNPGDPDDNNVLGGGPTVGQDEDDSDPAGPQVIDIALRKTTVTAGPYSYGQDVTFNIEVINQGSITLQNIDVTDYIPCGFTYVSGSQPWTLSGTNRVTKIAGPMAPGASVNLTITLKVQPCSTTDAWLNYAEVSYMENTAGTNVSLSDIDSDADNIKTNDAGGLAESPSDDAVSGNGTGTPLSNVAATDEDDQDPELIQVFDLALKKELITAGPYANGQLLTFNITVYNQGNVDATNVVISDYIPNGYSFAPNGGWTGGPSTATYTIASLAAGASVVVPIQLTFLSPASSTPPNWVNRAEISSATGGTDADSTPDSMVGNDNLVNPGDPDDNNVLGGGPTVGQDEDDSDPAGPQVIDIALRKTTVTAGPYSYGQDVTFNIEVINQGSVTLQNIDVTDYIPCGFTYVSGSQPWILSGTNRVTKIAGPMAPGASVNLTITLKVQPCSTADAWLNYAEVSYMENTAGTNVSLSDIDSDADNIKTNDAGGLAESPSDDAVNGNGTGTPLSNVAATDEDDQDPELIQVFDLALKKELITAGPYANGQLLTFNITVYNQGNVDATNVVISDYIPNGYSFAPNGGWTTSGPSTATYTIASLAAGASVVVPIQLTFLSPASSTPPNWVNRAEISSATGGTDADSTPDSMVGNDNLVNPGDPDDNNVLGGGPTVSQDEDDSDPAGPQVIDIALRKTTVTAGPYNYGQDITFNIEVINQGSVTLQNIDVTDYIPCGFTYVTGSQPWILSGTNRVTKIAGPMAPGASVNLTITLKLQPCSTADAWLNYAEVSYMENTAGTNVSLSDIDSDADNIKTNDAGGLAESPSDDAVIGNGTGTPLSNVAATDEDDQDPELIQIFDLALTKVLNTPAPYTFGQTHNFTITVYNQGNTTAQNISINDYVPDGYTFSANNGWIGTAGPGPRTITNLIVGPLLPGASTTVTLDLTFSRITTTSTSKSWINFAEVGSAQDGTGAPAYDVDSTPGSNTTNETNVLPDTPGDNNITSTSDTGVGSQDDHDPAGPDVFDLALRKTKVTALPSYSYGQTVMYQIEVFNQGNIPATNIEVTDYLPCGLEFSTSSPTNASWSLTGTKVTTTYTGTLNPGQSTILYLDLIVRECYTNQNTAWTNYSEISKADDTDPTTSSPPTDIDSTPDGINGNDPGGVPNFGGVTSGTDDTINNENGDEDDHDPLKIEVFDLALRKVLATPGPYSYGQALTFNIEVFNQGNVIAQNIQVSDYIPTGYTFVANNGWTGSSPTITRTIAGPLAPGASTGPIPLVLTLVAGTSGSSSWDNYAEVSASQDDRGNNRNDDADSILDGLPTNDNPVKPGDPDDNNILGGGPNATEDEDDHDPAAPQIVDIALRKTTVNPGPYKYGDVVSFNVQVINQGNVNLTDIDIVDYIPCGFEYVGGSQTWTLNGTQAQTNIAGVLAAGSSMTIRIDLRVKACSTPNAWLNYAEVRNMEDTQGNNLNLADIDSTPDNVNGNDDGGLADSANDDYVDGNGKASGGAPGDTATATDEDDHDPELIQVFDLALRKTLTTAGPHKYGDNLTFTITVFNQGNVAASNIVINDYIPAGYTFNGALNPTWNGAAPIVNQTIAGPLAPGASTTTTIVLTLVRSLGDAAWDNYAEIGSAIDNNGNPATDADSNPDSNPANDNPVTPGDPNDDNISGGGPTANQDEDDHDPAAPNIVDIALRKTTVTPGPYTYGQVVSFNIEVINQGNVTLTDATIVDYLPCGFEYVSGSQSWSVSGTQASTMLSGSLLPGQTSTVRIDLRVKACTSPNAWLNFAEVKSFEDINGTDISNQDIDSTPDNLNGNDDGGLAESPNDDYVDGDGKLAGGAPLDGGLTTDEDDHDPEMIQVFDLALKKVLVTSAPYVDGQPLTFNITVYNQGNVTAQSIVIKDYVPIGYTFDPMLNSGWSGALPTLTYNMPGTLAPGAFIVIPLVLNIEMTMGGDRNWINYSEIGSADDDSNPTNTPPTDADSTPSSNTPEENAVTPGSPNDDNINGGGPNAGQDEDDHDPAGPRLYDVALNKTTTATGPFSIGQVVKFDIAVFNQGNFPVRNIKVADYIPSGFKFRGTENFGVWTYDALSGNATTTIAQTLLPGQSTTVPIYLEVQPITSNFATGWTNRAEIYSFEDTSGNNVSSMDIDSNPDANPNNDPGGEPDGPSDDYVGGDGTGPIGGGPASTDEDDADPERIEIFDLALRKEVVTPGPYHYGNLIEFNITVFNQGNEPATNVMITDYIPVGYTFAASDNTGWIGAAPTPTYAIPGTIAPGASVTVKIYLRIIQTTGGEKDWINYSEIIRAADSDGIDRTTWDLDSNPGSNNPTENAVEPGDPADNNITSNNKGGEEDDHDPAGIEIFDLAQRKLTVNQTGPFTYGDQVTYTIEVFNQGSIAASNIEVTDNIPCGLKYVTSNNTNGWTYNSATLRATKIIAGPLAPGTSTTVTITLQVQQCIDTYVASFTNFTEISDADSNDPNEPPTDIDSTPDTNPTNDPGGEPDGPNDDVVNEDPNLPPGNDEDDHDPERIEVFDLALKKELVTAGPFHYGQTIDFNITVCNQGNVTAANIVVSDYLPAGYGFAFANNPGWAGTVAAPTYAIPGTLFQDQCVVIPVKLTILQTTGGEKNWVNYAEITSATDGTGGPRVDADSNPGSNNTTENAVEPGDPADNNMASTDKGGEEDDHDPAGIEIFDLAQRKVTANQTGPFVYGNQITYTVEVFNQGSISAGNIEVADNIPCGFKYLASNNAAGWAYDATSRIAKRIIAGPLAPGASTTVTITLELQQCIDNSVSSFTNYTEISDADSNDPNEPPTDIDSNPDTNPGNDPGGEPDGPNDDVVNEDPNLPPGDDEDDHDPERVEIFDLALKKELVTVGPFHYGQTLDFNITVCNQGNVTAANIVVSDYLPAGYGFAIANNPGWAGTVAAPTYAIPGTLAQDQCVVIPVKLTILQTTGGEKNWVNYAEITSATDGTGGPRVDADSNPGSNNATENAVEPGDPADNNMTSTDKGGEEDDHDPAGIEIFDLAQRKVTANQTGPFRYGDVVKFTYEVFNQGSVQASNIQLTDYIPCGYTYVAASNNPLGWAYNTTTGNATVTLTGSLAPGASKTIDIFLQIKPCINSSTTAWTNIGEIIQSNSDDPNEPPTDIDSNPDTNPDNDPGGEPDGPNDDVVNEDPNLPPGDDEDDHDPERLEIVDLALRKTMVSTGPFRYGDIIEFDIEVFNQGNVTMTDIEVVDYIPQGFTFDPAINAGWQGAYPSVFTIIPGPLAPETSIKVRLKLKLVQSNGGSRTYVNGAEISSMEDEDGNPRPDADSTPDSNPNNDNPVTPGDPNDDVVTESPNNPETPNDDDEDDSDPSGPKIFDLALRKVQLTALPSFSYGQTVSFGIQLFNQGNVAAKDIVIIDTLPCGLEYINTSTANIAAGWAYNPVTREVRTTYSNILSAGATVQITLEAQVVPCYTGQRRAWTNWAEIESADDNDPNTPNPPVDIDSHPDGNNTNDPGGQPDTPTDDEINGDPNNPNNPNAPQDEDDHDPHQIQVFDLALRKTVDYRGPYKIGETAVFRLNIFNQGNVPAKNIVLNDYMRSGFSFNPALNAGWSLVTAPTTSADGLLNYTIPTVLLPGESTTVTLNLVVALDANPAVTDWWNYAEVRAAQDTLNNNRNDDADSTPNSNSPYENNVKPDDPWDNVVNGNGPNFNQDEDDHDPEKVIVVGGLGDTVWKDLDGDGIQDPGEPGVANVIATLTDCRGNILATKVTDANGFYFFDNLIPGDYQVQFDIKNLPQGCAFTFQDQGSDDKKDSDVDLTGLGPCTNITGGEYDSSYDAGLLILAAIGDFVWHDLNGDGLQSAGEPGIPGVQVNLYKGDGTFVGTTFTNASGYYLFDFLYPGNYYLKFVDPTGFERTFVNRESNDAVDSDEDGSNGPGTTLTTYLAPGERDMTWDAGFYKCIPIGDLVWYDINKNDVWNTNENGINGLKVNLWRNHFGTWTIWEFQYTGHKPGTPSDDGYFKFCAPPGQYYVEVIMPPLGLVRARPNIGTNEEYDSDLTNANGVATTDNFTVLSGQEKCDLGAGFYPQAIAGNLVWRDNNANGAQEANEPKVEGVKVEAILASTKQVAASSVTDADGVYMIEGLEKQAYYLKFTPPSGLGATVAKATSDDLDSDVDHSNGANTTRVFEMLPAVVNENIDMGLVFGVLPVDWLDVNAVRVNNTHVISWTTAREVNVSHYIVERKLNNETEFTAIPGKVDAKGNTTQNSSYSLADLDVNKTGTYIYRVKQVDFDGKFTYSRLVKLSNAGESSIDMYPNPAKQQTNLQVVVAEDSEVSIELFDATSKLVKVIRKSEVQRSGDEVYNINLEDISAGVYNVVVTINGVTVQKKLIRIE